MAKQTKAVRESRPELREFVKEHDQRVFDFCYFLAAGQIPVEDIVVKSFRDFGEELRRNRAVTPSAANAADWAAQEQKLLLFQCAWRRMESALIDVSIGWMGGRDTRYLQAFDEDLLSSKPNSEKILERLSKVPLEFRAPVVLRDMCGFTDEEVFQVLQLRWGVYRHRLHRGRLAVTAALKGRREKDLAPVGV